MVPSTVPLQRCIPVLIVILRCPCFLDSFLPTVSIFADFPAVFRKAIIRLHGHHSHWFLNGNNSHSFSKEILCNAGEQFHLSTQPKQPPLSWACQAATRHSRTTAPQAKTLPSKQTSRARGLIWGFPVNTSKDAKSNSSSKTVISLSFEMWGNITIFKKKISLFSFN